MHYKDTDYLHAAARVTYLENQLITKEDLFKVIDADTAREAYRMLSSRELLRDHDMKDYEKAFEANLERHYALVEEITGELGLTFLFRYPIDGHNLKVMVKSKMAPGDFSGLYKRGGTIPVNILRKELDDAKFEFVPYTLGEAALEATEQLAKTRDAQIVDLLLDKAVIRLMSEKAAEIECETLSEFVRAKIDLINIKSALRLLRIQKDTYSAASVFAEGGSFTIKELESAYNLGYDGIRQLTRAIPQADRVAEAIAQVKQGSSIAVFEQQEDGCFKDLFDKTKIIPFGIEPVIAFLYRKDQEIRACRMVLASKLFGIAKEQIAERLRYIYAD